MPVKHAHIGWWFFFRWVAVTAVGWTAGLAVLVLVPETTADPLVEGFVIAVAGTLVGALQWLILRRELSRAGWWVLASIAGWIVGLAITVPYFAFGVWILEATQGITRELSGVTLGLTAGTLIGSVVGAAQWLVLRQKVRRASTWILANLLGWTVILTTFSLIPEVSPGTFLGGTLASSAAAGGITGALLVLLLRPPSTRFVGMRVRLLAIFSLLFASSLLGAFFWFYNNAMNETLDERAEEIKTLLRAVPASIDGDRLKALYREGERRADGLTDDPRYWEQVDWLATVCGECPYAFYTFVRTEEAGEIAFVTDTLSPEGTPGAARFGETRTLAEGDPAWRGFTDATVTTDAPISLSGVLNDVLWQWPTSASADAAAGTEGWLKERGARISGFAPIRNAQGEAVGVLAIDLQEAHVAQVRAGLLRTMFRSFGDLFVFMLLAAFLVARAFTKPITALTEAARRIGQGEFEQDLSHIREGSFFHHEIDDLAEAIEESGRAHISERRLREQVHELTIQINQARRQQQVAQIVEDDFFQDLQARAQQMRTRRRGAKKTDEGGE